MGTTSGDVELTTDELREVVRYAVACAEPALVIFERASPLDSRPAAALEAARVFAAGAPRSRLQRTSATAAHRAAKDTDDEAAGHAATAAGDAAAAAYLHPLAKATQVRHNLGAAAHAARAAELAQGDDPNVTDKRFPGNPTRSYRTTEPLRVLEEVVGLTYPPEETVRHMRARVAELAELGIEAMDD